MSMDQGESRFMMGLMYAFETLQAHAHRSDLAMM